MMRPSLKHSAKLATTMTTRLFSGESSQTKLSTIFAAKQPNTVTKQTLFSEFYRLGPNAVGKVADILQGMKYTGKHVPNSALIHCLKDLRKHVRYQICLEILEWVEKSRNTMLSGDYALHLNILWRLKGIDEVEKYFDSIPPDSKDRKVYGALLHCYCSELAIDKAVAVFDKMDELGCASCVLVFGCLMSMYLKGGQPEKVPVLVEEIRRRNIPLNGFTYSIWMRSYQLLGDVEGFERLIHKTQEQDYLKDDWDLLGNIAAVYIGFDQSEKAIPALEKLEDLLFKSKDIGRKEYQRLISLYSCTGKLDSVIRVWDKLSAKFKGGNNSSYLTLLDALSKLGDMESLLKYFREWESSCTTYEGRIAAVVMGAYLKHDMVEEAELLLKDATTKSGYTVRAGHVKFMNYYFQKRQTDSALKHMEIAIAANWKPVAEKLEPCFQLFKEEKDIDGVEEFFGLLKKARPVDARAYLWLLQTYAGAQVTAPNMRQRIEDGGVDITPEIEEVLDKVCPNIQSSHAIAVTVTANNGWNIQMHAFKHLIKNWCS